VTRVYCALGPSGLDVALSNVMPNREPNPNEVMTIEPDALETITPAMLMMMMVMGGFGGADSVPSIGVSAAPKYVEPQSLGGRRTGNKGW
jgi:hypothetical protein